MLSGTICILIVVNGSRPMLEGGEGQQKLCSLILENYMIFTPTRTAKINKNSCTRFCLDI